MRPRTGSPVRAAFVCDGATDDELQLATIAAATRTPTTEFVKGESIGLYPGFVALDSMYAAPTTSISELPGIHDSAKHERGGAPYFVSSQNEL